jgi:hypothetical protein
MIAEGDHYIVEFLERNEATAVFDLVIINRVSKFSDLGTQ